MSKVEKPSHAELNEYAQKWGTNRKLPEYQITERTSNNRKEFIAKCQFEGNTTEGIASSKNEAKRISASHMLALLYELDSSKFLARPKKPVQAKHEEIIQLEDFDSCKLEVYLDTFLDNREKDSSKFRRLFLGDFSENTELQFESNESADSPKSKTLEKLKISGLGVVNLANACILFKAIVQEMKLIYFAEFLETAKNDRYAVLIKINFHLLAAGGIGETPKMAIQDSCKNAIEFLHIFNW